ncbi:FG-GAP repeat domain-containing protein [Streptomyces sp. NPDC058000]|uniref:FG-GAP repeat domain-containing protein n=1 Tax=Streptomyces sp. NPDC058000 TaxID=3346299 RepID=UPI0036ED49AA
MGFLPGRKRGRALTQLATAVLAATLLGTTAGTAVADSPTPVPAPLKNATPDMLKPTVPQPPKGPKGRMGYAAPGEVGSPYFHLSGVDRDGDLYQQTPNGNGFDARDYVWFGWDIFKAVQNVDHNKDGYADAFYSWDFNGNLYYTYDKDNGDADTRTIGGGWNTYDKVLSPGDLGGAKESDLMAVDKSGVLYTYLAYPDGKVTPRTKIGAGWGQYTQIAGQGDLTGDGKADIVARDASGVLWLYKGTGNHKAPFESRQKIGAGWNAYNYLLSTGDVDRDGNADLLARTANGDLMLYKGTGNARAPFAKPVKVGWGYQTYRLMF